MHAIILYFPLVFALPFCYTAPISLLAHSVGEQDTLLNFHRLALLGFVPYHIEGVGVGFAPPLLDKTFFDEARGIDEAQARQMAWRLAREEGIFAGTSTGMNVVGAIALAQELGVGQSVVTVAADSGLEYLAGDLYGQDNP